MKMKVIIKDECMMCGACTTVEGFELKKDKAAYVKKEIDVEKVREAMSICPASSIALEVEVEDGN